MKKTTTVIGAILVWTAIILGAFGAHILKSHLSNDQLLSIETGIRYQLFQGLAIIVLSLNTEKIKFSMEKILYCMIIGTLLFSLSIYLLVLLNSFGWRISILGLITPIGGSVLIGSWIYFTFCLIRKS